MRTKDPELHARRERQVITGSAATFARHGYAGTTVTQLRCATGLSSGALFHYFPDKAAIFRAVIASGRREQRDRLDLIDQTKPDTAFWAVIEILAEEFTDPTAVGMTTAILERVGVDPELAAILSEQDTAVMTLLTDLLSRLRDRGKIDQTIVPAMGARWILGVLDGMLLNCADPAFDPADQTRFLMLAIRRTLQLPEQSSPR